MRRQVEQQREWWDRAQTEAKGRLARIDRGESWAPAQVVRCLRMFVGPEVRR
ncbi:MAG: hypothetical protein JWO98_673 [Frankiales bacterium]|nr:hypothetical protein [Frankiales bacterium]